MKNLLQRLHADWRSADHAARLANCLGEEVFDWKRISLVVCHAGLPLIRPLVDEHPTYGYRRITAPALRMGFPREAIRAQSHPRSLSPPLDDFPKLLPAVGKSLSCLSGILLPFIAPHSFTPNWLYVGKNRGWSLRYKKTKALCTLLPEYRRLSAVVVMGGEREKFEERRYVWRPQLVKFTTKPKHTSTENG